MIYDCGKFLRIAFVFLLVSASIFVFFHPKNLETNILKAILSQSEKDTLIVDLSKKQSGKINVVFESSDFETLSEIEAQFFDNLDKNVFYTNDIDIENTLETYKKYQTNLLSDNTAALIKKGDYDSVVNQALERLYNPVGVTFLPLQEDPFLLFGDFIQSLSMSAKTSQSEVSNNNETEITAQDGTLELEGKYYETAEFFIKKDIALSPSLLNKEMKKLVDMQKSMSDEKTRIYLSGAPVHTYFAGSKSMKEINLICLLSSFFVIFICKIYFKSFKILFPVAISLGLGMFAGFLAASMAFDSIHILTFVFASTLIGICVDYSLHYFSHNGNLQLIQKSLTQSLLTTVCAFLVLLFSDIELLRQISVFTAVGLVTVYLFVVLFYPVLCKNINLSDIKPLTLFEAGKKVKAFVYIVFALVIAFGLFNIKFNDDIKDMYVPPKVLAQAEALYAKLSHKNFNYNFITVKAKDSQDLLEKEEAIAAVLEAKGFEYYALSRFVPSVKKQKENVILRQKLYKNSLKQYAQFLTPKEIKTLLKPIVNEDFLTPDKVGIAQLQDFMASENTSVIIVNASMPDTLIKNVKNIGSGDVINLKNDISQKVKTCRHACLMLFGPAVFVLFLILALIYRPVNALKITAPSFIGAVFAVSLAGLVSDGINLFHVLAMFLITGFSIDYSIFRFNGISGKNSESAESAVLISCATSAFSFFLLSMTSFKLISSLGFVLCAGILSSYILSVFIISKSSDEQIDKE